MPLRCKKCGKTHVRTFLCEKVSQPAPSQPSGSGGTPKHSPAPWNLEGSSVISIWEGGERVQVCSLNNTHWSIDPQFDDVKANRANNLRMKEEAAVNRLLISKAPEMYEALKAVSISADAGGDGSVMIEDLAMMHDAVLQARAILDSIEGRRTASEEGLK